MASLWNSYTTAMDGRAVVATMRHTWKALERRFGRMEMERITEADCLAHTETRRAAGIKDGTIHTELGHLRMVALWAAKRRLIDRAPYIARPAKPRPAEKHLTREQARAVIDAAQFPHVRLFVILALGTGARSAALLGLTWDRVDLERGIIDLRDPAITRPHKGRAIVPINRTVRAALIEAYRARTPDCRHVIEWAGKPVAAVKRALATAGVAAGAGHVTPHMLRHSAAVHMVEAGVSMEETAQFLGHSNVATTRLVYARFSPNHLREAARVLEYDDLAAKREKKA